MKKIIIKTFKKSKIEIYLEWVNYQMKCIKRFWKYEILSHLFKRIFYKKIKYVYWKKKSFIYTLIYVYWGIDLNNIQLDNVKNVIFN